MGICMALLENRLETSLALNTTTMAIPTSLQCIGDMLRSQWPKMICDVAERIVNAFAFGEAGSARAKLAAANLTGAILSRAAKLAHALLSQGWIIVYAYMQLQISGRVCMLHRILQCLF